VICDFDDDEKPRMAALLETPLQLLAVVSKPPGGERS
jgi:hypothetical protein